MLSHRISESVVDSSVTKSVKDPSDDQIVMLPFFLTNRNNKANIA